VVATGSKAAALIKVWREGDSVMAMTSRRLLHGPAAVGTMIVLVWAGCDDTVDPSVPDAGDAAAAIDAAADGPPEMAASGGAEVGNNAGSADAAREALPDLGSVPLPDTLAPPVRIVPGDLQLVGDGASACTHQFPPSGNGDRWCAFKRAVASDATEMWVVNVTKAMSMSMAMSGAPPPCDGSSPDCLRLSTSVWTLSPLAGPSQRAANRFDGDTLFIHDRARSVGENAFEGAISVWRPGWAAPRQLSAGANACFGDARHAVAFCLDAVTHEGFIPVEFDLRAGSIANGTGGVLPLVERVRLLRADGEPSVHATFTADGTSFVYSAPPVRNAPAASLRVVKLDQIGVAPATTLLPDVMDWELSRDGRSLYYIADYADRGGTLVVVDLPGADNPRRLPFRVNGYVVRGPGGDRDEGLGLFVPVPAGGLEYRLLPDSRAPDRQLKLFSYRQSLEALMESKDLRFTAYTKPENGERGFVARGDGSGECMLSPQRGRPPYDYAFLDHAGLVFWVEAADGDPDNAFDGWMADPASCGNRQRFSERIAFHRPLGDRAVLFADEFQDGTVTLKYAPLAGGTWPAGGPLRIRAGIDFPVILLPDGRHLVFQVTRGPETERGLYLFALPAVP
jgi:hypothetical protein